MWSFSDAVERGHLRPKNLVSIASLVLGLALAGPALAAPTAADVESAKAQYLEGTNLRAKGDELGALTHFKAAYALVPTPITALEVGRSQLALGKVLEGRETLLKAAHMPKAPEESAKADEARREAERLADAAKARLATITVASAESKVVRIDGITIPADARTAPRFVDPGHHVVEVQDERESGKLELDVAEGESRTVSVPLSAVALPPTEPGPFRIHPLVFVGFGPGAALLLAGAATGIGALVTAGKLATDCRNKVCPPSSSSTIDTSTTLGTVSTITFVAGGAFVVVGVVGLLLSHREPPKSAWILPTFGLGALGLEGGF